jgi:hypothetical protein
MKCRSGQGTVVDEILAVVSKNHPVNHSPQSDPPSKGLGDHVSAALSSVGITKELVSDWLGEECGCAERQEKLNQLGSWASRVVQGTLKDAAAMFTSITGLSSPVKSAETQLRSLIWSYGVTTVPSRLETTLPQTLDSLKLAGFSEPRLFVDASETQHEASYRVLGHPVTFRDHIRTAGHWILTLYELYIRKPHADRYAIFQDDFVTVRNLKAYLDNVSFPDKGYLNLYTFPSNQSICPTGYTGLYMSNQNGRGAVALVFTAEGVKTLLAHRFLLDKMQDPERGHRSIDGGISDTMKLSGWFEYVHNPSLVQHTGIVSSMGNNRHPLAESFPGESFDALSLLS